MKFFMILISLNAFATTKAEKAIKVVYGNDDRVEAILSHIQYQELAYSTVALIDEKFLVNDLENDELGKSINEMDLEQCRYFDKPYGIYNLLNIDAVINNELIPFNDLY